MSSIVKQLLFFILLLTALLFIPPPEPAFALTAKSNCAVTKVGNPAEDFKLPEGCSAGRGRLECKPGEPGAICAFRNILDYTSFCCRYVGWPGHQGVDLIAPVGTPQYAIEDMIIVTNNFNGCVQPSVWDAEKPHPGAVSGPGGGRRCYEKDDTSGQRWFHGRSTGWRVQTLGLTSKMYYDHFHLMSKSPVVLGSTIKAGSIIGYTGRTGHSPGPSHLHLQVSRPQCHACWDNPETMLRNYPNLGTP